MLASGYQCLKVLLFNVCSKYQYYLAACIVVESWAIPRSTVWFPDNWSTMALRQRKMFLTQEFHIPVVLCILKNFYGYLFLIYEYEHFAFTYVYVLHICLVSRDIRKEHWIPCNWSYRPLGVTVWELGAVPGSTARTSALHHQATMPSPSGGF